MAKYNGNQVVLCKDFTDELGALTTLSLLGESSMDTDDSKHEYFFEDLMYELSKIVKGDSEEITNSFLDMYMWDSLLGNPDRHSSNWGLVKKDAVYKFSPKIPFPA